MVINFQTWEKWLEIYNLTINNILIQEIKSEYNSPKWYISPSPQKIKHKNYEI